MSERACVGFALFLYLSQICWVFFTLFSLSPNIVILLKGPKCERICVSMLIFNYADCFTLRFVFNVMLMILT